MGCPLHTNIKWAVPPYKYEMGCPLHTNMKWAVPSIQISNRLSPPYKYEIGYPLHTNMKWAVPPYKYEMGCPFHTLTCIHSTKWDQCPSIKSGVSLHIVVWPLHRFIPAHIPARLWGVNILWGCYIQPSLHTYLPGCGMLTFCEDATASHPCTHTYQVVGC